MEITHVALWPQAESNRYPQLRRLSLCPLELCGLIVPDSHEHGNEAMKNHPKQILVEPAGSNRPS